MKFITINFTIHSEHLKEKSFNVITIDFLNHFSLVIINFICMNKLKSRNLIIFTHRCIKYLDLIKFDIIENKGQDHIKHVNSF